MARNSVFALDMATVQTERGSVETVQTERGSVELVRRRVDAEGVVLPAAR